MLKAQESHPKLRPMYLFQAKLEKDKLAYLFISDSKEKIWLKQAPTEWEEIKIDKFSSWRGEITCSFSGKAFTKLFIPSDLPSWSRTLKELPYVEGTTSSGDKNLTELLLSKEKLDDLGITKFLELDLEYVPKVTTQEQEAAHDARIKALKTEVKSQYFKKSGTDFFDDILEKGRKSIQASETKRAERKYRLAGASIFGEYSDGASALDSEKVNDEKLTEKVSQLAL